MMRIGMSHLVIVALVVAFSAGAKANMVDGNKLYTACTTPESSDTHWMDLMYCVGYVVGMTDALDAVGRGISQIADVSARLVCIPDGVTSGQMKDVVVKHMKDHAEDRHLPAFFLVSEAVSNAWPCEKKTE